MSVKLGSPGQAPTQDAESWQELKGDLRNPQNALEAKATFEKIERGTHKPMQPRWEIEISSNISGI